MNKFEFYKTVLIVPFIVFVSLLHAETKSRPKSYNHLFEIRNIAGWTVYVNKKDLLEHPDEMNAALEYLHAQFYQVLLNVPKAAVNQTQQRAPL